jgi:hypothetical protein
MALLISEWNQSCDQNTGVRPRKKAMNDTGGFKPGDRVRPSGKLNRNWSPGDGTVVSVGQRVNVRWDNFAGSQLKRHYHPSRLLKISSGDRDE